MMIYKYIILIFFSYGASSYNIYDLCDGKVNGGIHSQVTFKVDRCLTPENSDENDVIEYAIDNWNNLWGMWDRFSFTSGDSNCDFSTNDGHWEIAFVDWDTNELHGKLASTLHNYRFDCSNGGALQGATILINNDITTDNLIETDPAIGAREVLIHELGHVLGLQHEDRTMSVMHTDKRGGKVGRRSGRANSSLGRGTETTLPNDTIFAFRYHDSTNPGYPDLLVSPWEHSFGENRLIYGEHGRTIGVCPGRRMEVRVSFENMGKIDLDYSQKTLLRVVMSTNDYISDFDTRVYEEDVWGGAGGFGTFNLEFDVPSNMPAGYYYAGVIIDPLENVLEDNEYNNATLTGLKLQVYGQPCS